MQLDKVDKKILAALVQNARQPMNRIAKNASVSKSTVLYRIKKLEEHGIITGYKTLINYDMFGTMYGRAQFKLSNVSTEQQQAIIGELQRVQAIDWLATTQGIADIACTISTDSFTDMARILGEIQAKIGKKIKSQEVSFGYKVYHCAPNVILPTFIEPITRTYSGKQQETQAFDRELLASLEKNATQSILSLAQQLNVSTKRVMAHKKHLEEANVIRRYTVELDTNKLGYETYHIFWTFNEFSPQHIEQFIQHLALLPETIYITQAHGRANLECEFLVPNQRKLYALVEQLKHQFPKLISDYEYFLTYRVYKTQRA